MKSKSNQGKQAWHPCCRRVAGSVDPEALLAELDDSITVAWMTGAGERRSVDVGRHRVIDGPLPSHRQPAGDLLNYDVVLVAAAASGAERLASDVLVGARTTLKSALWECSADKHEARPLYGLVLAGGQSTRMGRDKADLEVVSGEPQAVRAAKLLEPFCQRVHLSVRPDQELDILEEWDRERWPLVEDGIVDSGPMAGIISAQRIEPEAAWLVVACDLPNLTDAAITSLLLQRKPLRFATAFRSVHDGFPEPLCAVYEPKSLARLLQFLASGYRCPRRVLNNSRIELVDQDDEAWMTNMNHPEEFEAAKSDLG